MVMETLLKRGLVVATFNFRGAGHSAGRTSWTSKPEQDDYSSIIGFLSYYIGTLDPFRSDREATLEDKDVPLQADKPPRLIIGGYSYGSIVTSMLPPLEHILEHFEIPASESHAAHIRLRAESLAEQQNDILETARTALRKRHAPTSPTRRSIRVGGEDDGSGTRSRSSHEGSSRRSCGLDDDLFRRSMHDLLGKHRKHDTESSHNNEPAEGKLPPNSRMVAPKPAYLLISPLQGLASHLVTMSILPSSISRQRDASAQAAEDKLVQNPTLAIFGDDDGFSQVGKLRAWVKRLGEQDQSQFRGEEVSGAGHFWAEDGVLREMLHFIDTFAKEL